MWRGPPGCRRRPSRDHCAGCPTSRRQRGSEQIAARELSYVASPAASGLASGRTTTVGVVMPFATRWYFMRVVEGVEAELSRAGYDLLIYNFGDRSGASASSNGSAEPQG